MLILADEPTGNLDPENKEQIINIISEYVKQSKAAMITVTHDYELLPKFDRTVAFQSLMKQA